MHTQTNTQMEALSSLLQNALTHVLVRQARAHPRAAYTQAYATHMHKHTQGYAFIPFVAISSLLRFVLVNRGYELLSSPTHWACGSLLLHSPIPYADFLCPATSASPGSLPQWDLQAWAHALVLFIPSLAILHAFSSSTGFEKFLAGDTVPASARIIAAILTASMAVDVVCMIHPGPIEAAPYRAAGIALAIRFLCVAHRMPLFTIAVLVTYSSVLMWFLVTLGILIMPRSTTRPLLLFNLLGYAATSPPIPVETIPLLTAFASTVVDQVPPVASGLVALDGIFVDSVRSCFRFYADRWLHSEWILDALLSENI